VDGQLISTRHTTQIWDNLFNKGITRITCDLSQFVGRELNSNLSDLRQVILEDVPDILGGSEALAIGISSAFSGSANGSLMLVYQPELAFMIGDVIAGNDPGTIQNLNEVELSFLSESGNIMSSSFLHVIADSLNLTLRPAPSKVLVDMSGTILDIALLEILDVNEDVFISDLSLCSGDYKVNSQFLIVPSPGLLELTLASVRT
jgi:chemotaxis protein CheC